MDPLTEYLHARENGRDRFALMYSYPFLLMRGPKEGLGKKSTFVTEIASGIVARKHFEQLQRLHKEGKQFDSEAQNTVVFKVRKSPSIPYPNLIMVGRTGQCDIRIPDGRISKLHAYFTHDTATGVYSLSDAGSRNATRINGASAAPKKAMPLAYGDFLEFGHLGFHFLSASELYHHVIAAVKPLERAS